tara:strand:+ start:185 stop:502 length:318 start_codon:yes stop_codon:yes gene_type:complete
MQYRYKLDRLKFSLENKFRRAAKYVAPPLYRKLCENKVKTLYETRSAEDGFGNRLRGDLIKRFLAEAGHNPDADAPYKNILGLEGGKTEYDTKLPTSGAVLGCPE